MTTYNDAECGVSTGNDIDEWAKVRASCQSSDGNIMFINQPQPFAKYQLFVGGEESIDHAYTWWAPQNFGMHVIKSIDSDSWVIATSTPYFNSLPPNTINNDYSSVTAFILTRNSTNYFPLTEQVVVSDPQWRNKVMDVLSLPNGNIVFASGAYRDGTGSFEYEDIQLDLRDDELNFVSRIRLMPGSSMDNVQMIHLSDNRFLVAARKFTRSGSGIINNMIWVAKLDQNLNFLWSRTFRSNYNDTYFLKMFERSDNNYVLTGRTGANDDNFYLVSLDDNGNVNWESTLTHEDPANIFDVFDSSKGDVYIASNDFKDIVFLNSPWVIRYPNGTKIDRYTIYPDLSSDIAINEGQVNIGKVGSKIFVSDERATEFESGFSVNLVATSSITMYPGTWVKPGAVFSGVAVEEVTTGDCESYGIPSGRVSFALDDKHFSNEVDVENIFLVYPNPTADWFKVFLNLHEHQVINISFVDVMGEEVWGVEYLGDKFEESFSTSNLSNGLYFLRIKTSLGQHRVIKVLIRK